MTFDWEKPLVDLEQWIAGLQASAKERGIDVSEELARWNERAEQLRKDIYMNLTPWQKVQVARHPKRPTTLDYIGAIFTDFVEMHGDRTFRDDPAMVGGVALLGDIPVTVIGPQKGRDTKENIQRNFGSPHPEGYRKALRLMRQAAKFGRPIITLVDVVGAYPGIEAEERGQGVAIAECIRHMSFLEVPVLCVVTGEGGSGGALAIGVGDRMLMLEHAWYSVISPEMCAQILWKDPSRAAQAAEALKLTAQDLLRLGVVDRIVPEPLGGAHRDPQEMARRLKLALSEELEALLRVPPKELLEARLAKFRRLGVVRERQERTLRRPATSRRGQDASPKGSSGSAPDTPAAEKVETMRASERIAAATPGGLGPMLPTGGRA